MKWPFVRRSKYESMINEKNEQKGYKEWWQEQSNILILDNTSNMVEINRLNQELASELNSHRSTKKYNLTINKELEEIKDALKIAQEDLEKKVKII